MHEITSEQLNTKEYWDKVYSDERGSGKERIDPERLNFVAESIKYNNKMSGSFLDVGCGNGEFMEKLHKIYPTMNYHGIDIANGVIHLNTMDYPMVHFAVGSAEGLPYENEYFDVVWCGETLEHLKDPVGAMKELFRVCKKSGLVMISVPLKLRNPSPEHLWEFHLMDFVNCQYGILSDLDVVCSGISQIGCWVKK